MQAGIDCKPSLFQPGVCLFCLYLTGRDRGVHGIGVLISNRRTVLPNHPYHEHRNIHLTRRPIVWVSTCWDALSAGARERQTGAERRRQKCQPPQTARPCCRGACVGEGRRGADLGGLLAPSLGVWQQATPPQYCAHIALLPCCSPLDPLPRLNLHRHGLALPLCATQAVLYGPTASL